MAFFMQTHRKPHPHGSRKGRCITRAASIAVFASKLKPIGLSRSGW
ncbi:hypothetical protein [Burkholderia ubonensis]|nr:hypothetical protein [Burkholderia ubonensis]